MRTGMQPLPRNVGCAGTTRRVSLLAAVSFAILVLMWPRPSTAQDREVIVARPSSPAGLPLSPARVVHFRVTEGTWMSLDVSPDGQTIVFDLLGDLYTVPITGGHARQLTSGMAFNSQPRCSPDGRQMVYVSDRSGSPNLWIADREGRGARQISSLHGDWHGSVTSPAWSPDGRTIVVSQKLSATRRGLVTEAQSSRWLLAVYDLETERMRWVTDTTADQVRAALGPTFSHDGHYLYAAVKPFLPGFEADNNYQIERIHLQTGRMQPVMRSFVSRTGMRPTLSRDGRYLVYATSSGSHVGLRLRDLRTDREKWLVREVLDDPPYVWSLDSRDLVPGYAFAPDSKSVIAAYGGKIHQIDIATARAVVIPFVVDVERGLGPLTVKQFSLPDTAVRTRSVMQAALSPDGAWVAFSVLDRIWVMQLPQAGRPAGRPRRLTADSVGEFYPSWSPDGQWIAYSTWLDGEGGAVRRARVTIDPARPPAISERLTADTALYFHTAVSPDGQRVVAVRAPLPPERLTTHGFPGAPPLDLALVALPAIGGLPRNITSLSAVQAPVRWQQHRSPVEQVYFTANGNRIYVGLTSWRQDGTDRRTALVLPERDDTMSFVADMGGVLSPDGRRALITHKYALFELAVPGLGQRQSGGPDTLELEQARRREFGAPEGAAKRWGNALAPWVSWSQNGRRVLFVQGGSLFMGDLKPGDWTSFTRVDVPLVIPVDVPRGMLVLHGARLITMRGKEVIERGDLVVRDNRIVGVGAAGQVPIPMGARVLDVTGTTILPGYVDIHDHVRLSDGVHPQQSWQWLVRLAYGITTLRDPWPDPGFYSDVFAYRERERAGDLLSPRVFTTGIAYLEGDPPIRTLEAARDAVRPSADFFGSETFKVYYDPAGRGARQLLAMALKEAGLNATVEGSGNAARQLSVIIDGFSGLEHLIPVRIYDDVVTLIAQSGTTHTQTYATTLGWSFMFRRHGGPLQWAKVRRLVPPSARPFVCVLCDETYSSSAGVLELDNVLPLASGAERIVARGGRVGIGSHGDVPGLGFHYEMWLHAIGGMPNHEVLRSATIIGATAIGHAQDIGSLEPGKLADLQALEGNPLEDLHHTTSIRYVMKNGRLYKGEDLREIWPRSKGLAPIYFWDSSVPGSEQRAHTLSVAPVRDKYVSDEYANEKR